MATIELTSVIERNERDFLANHVGEEMVIMDIKSGNYIGINAVGARIWNMLDAPTPVALIIADLMEVYDVDEETCRTQTLEYLDKMAEQRLVLHDQSA